MERHDSSSTRGDRDATRSGPTIDTSRQAGGDTRPRLLPGTVACGCLRRAGVARRRIRVGEPGSGRIPPRRTAIGGIRAQGAHSRLPARASLALEPLLHSQPLSRRAGRRGRRGVRAGGRMRRDRGRRRQRGRLPRRHGRTAATRCWWAKLIVGRILRSGDLGRALEIGIGIGAIAVMLVCAAGIVTTARRYLAHRRERAQARQLSGGSGGTAVTPRRARASAAQRSGSSGRGGRCRARRRNRR